MIKDYCACYCNDCGIELELDLVPLSFKLKSLLFCEVCGNPHICNTIKQVKEYKEFQLKKTIEFIKEEIYWAQPGLLC